jgi:hypothetical protein
MEVCRDSATQYGESEKCIISFLRTSGDETLQDSGNEMSVYSMSAQYGGKWSVSGSSHFTLKKLYRTCGPNGL